MKPLMVSAVVVVLSVVMMGLAFAGANDKLLVKDSGGTNNTLVVTDQRNSTSEGTVGIGIDAPKAALHVEGTVRPQFVVSNQTADGSGFANARMDFVRGNNHSVSQLLFGTGAVTMPASHTLDFQMGMFNDSVFQMRVVNQPGKGIAIAPSTGYVGIGTTSPTNTLTVCGTGGCAYNNGGTTWNNASSREYKDNIHDLGAGDAMEALKRLTPVTFTYKSMPDEGRVGFIAEDVPELVATKDRKGLSPMDIVAVLTKVVQEQQGLIKELQGKNERLEERLLALEAK